MSLPILQRQKEITEVMNRLEVTLRKAIQLREKYQAKEVIQVLETKVMPEEMAVETEGVKLNKYRFKLLLKITTNCGDFFYGYSIKNKVLKK